MFGFPIIEEMFPSNSRVMLRSKLTPSHFTREVAQEAEVEVVILVAAGPRHVVPHVV